MDTAECHDIFTILYNHFFFSNEIKAIKRLMFIPQKPKPFVSEVVNCIEL